MATTKNERTGMMVAVRSIGCILMVSAASLYPMLVIVTGSWTPLIYDFGSPPPGYQSVAAFREARGHDFPALFEEPAPAPVAGTGHLVGVEDGRPYGTNVSGVDVKTLRLERFLGTSLTVHLDVPISEELSAHLQSLSKGAIITVSGIGHGDGRFNIYIYPVHRVNGYEP